MDGRIDAGFAATDTHLFVFGGYAPTPYGHALNDLYSITLSSPPSSSSSTPTPTPTPTITPLFTTPTITPEEYAHLGELHTLLGPHEVDIPALRTWLSSPLSSSRLANSLHSGNLALVKALAKDSPAPASLLISFPGIDLAAPDSAGTTPLEAALGKGHVETAQLIAGRLASAAMADDAVDNPRAFAPSPRTGASVAVKEGEHSSWVFVCGGRELEEKHVQMHVFDTAAGAWIEPPVPTAKCERPACLAGARAAYYPPLDAVFVFGGGGVWIYAVATGVWSRLRLPRPWDAPFLADFALSLWPSPSNPVVALLSGGTQQNPLASSAASASNTASNAMYLFSFPHLSLVKSSLSLPRPLTRHLGLWTPQGDLYLVGGSSPGSAYAQPLPAPMYAMDRRSVSSSTTDDAFIAGVMDPLSLHRDMVGAVLPGLNAVVAGLGRSAGGYRPDLIVHSFDELSSSETTHFEFAATEIGSVAFTTGEVFASGFGGHLQLGLDAAEPPMVSAIPAPVAVGENRVGAEHIAANGVVSFAIGSTGDVYVWGANLFAEPVIVPGLRGRQISKMAPGVVFAVALSSATGSLWQMGTDGAARSISMSVRPITHTPWAPEAHVVDISGGALHVLILDSMGRVYALGENPRGQLGINAPFTKEPCQVQFEPESVVISAISAGAAHSVALSECGGRVYVWGNGYGIAHAEHVYTPLQVELLPIPSLSLPVTGIATSEASYMLIDADGTLFAAGDATNGRLGTGSAKASGEDGLLPGCQPLSKVPGLEGEAVVSVVGNGAYTHGACAALTESGAVYVWGSNAQGRLGLGSMAQDVLWVPTRHPWADAVREAGTPVVQMAAGGAHFLFRTLGCEVPSDVVGLAGDGGGLGSVVVEGVGKEEVEETFDLEDFPPELLFEIADLLDLPSFLALGMCSTFFAHVVADPLLWRRKYIRMEWMESPSGAAGAAEAEATYRSRLAVPWADVFRERYLVEIRPKYQAVLDLERRRAEADANEAGPSNAVRSGVSWVKSLVRKTLRMGTGKKIRGLVIGLDASGKTSLLYRLVMGDWVQTIPTIGFNVENVSLGRGTVTFWDVGGCDKIRPLVRHYLPGTTLFVVCINANDSRLNESADELQSYTLTASELEPRARFVLVVQHPAGHQSMFSDEEIRATFRARTMIDHFPWEMVSFERGGDIDQVREVLDAAAAALM